tara:strand:- start:233 stop:889 length:657 start_codon:yes stop_codon:yes gene_type:complete
MYTRIKNFFHIRLLMNIYSIRNMITGNGAVWLKLNTQDLENMVETTVSRLSLNLRKRNVLDLGCGTGAMLSYLSREKRSVPYGVDLSRLNLYQCRKKMANGHFSRQDIIKYLDKEQTKFDLVILYGVIGCFTVDQQRIIIDKISNILNPEGVLWIGANIYTDSSYKFQTYPVPRGFYEEICSSNKSLDLEEFSELEIFGNGKYDPDQTTVLLSKNRSS